MKALAFGRFDAMSRKLAPPVIRGENSPRVRGEAQAIQASDARPLIIGHRGAAGLAPENTMAAFSAALALGVDAVEFDVQFTSDGRPVVIHDENLERMAGVPARIRDLTQAALAGFDVGFRHGTGFRGQRVPPLEDVARLMPVQTTLHAEVKDYDPVDETHLRVMIDTLDRFGGLARTVFSSPHEETLSEILRLCPGARTALLLFARVNVPTDAARRAAHLGCVAVNPAVSLVTSELVQLCHRHGMQVLTFTVNERGTMRKLTEMGVDGFFTDYPDRLMADAGGDARDGEADS